jgi:hypothetical protein
VHLLIFYIDPPEQRGLLLREPTHVLIEASDEQFKIMRLGGSVGVFVLVE